MHRSQSRKERYARENLPVQEMHRRGYRHCLEQDPRFDPGAILYLKLEPGGHTQRRRSPQRISSFHARALPFLLATGSLHYWKRQTTSLVVVEHIDRESYQLNLAYVRGVNPRLAGYATSGVQLAWAQHSPIRLLDRILLQQVGENGQYRR